MPSGEFEIGDGVTRLQPVDLATTSAFELGGLRVDPAIRQIGYPDGTQERLEPRVMETLVALHRVGGEVLSRDELMAACWRGTVVGEDAIQRVIQRLRKVAARSGEFRIETISKAGYRLVDVLSQGDGGRGDAPSLAVLPFRNRSGLPADEGFALGMAEDLVDALAMGVNVRVIASSATTRFRDKPVTDFPTVGQRLGVRYFLEGHIRQADDKLQVTARLIEAASSALVWTQRFERPLDEFAQLQGDLVTEVAAALGATIYKLEMDRALRKPANLTAWECTARAIAAIREYGAEALFRSIEESAKAIAIAPDYGLAHAIHAQTIAGAYLSLNLPDMEREREIQQGIDRAFALDPDHAGVLAAIATASAYIGRPAEGQPRALRAIRLRPGHGMAYYAAGVNALLLGQEGEAIDHLDQFLAVEPESHLHYITHAWRGIAEARLDDFGAARAAFDDSFALYPGNFIALLVLTCVEQREGRTGTAVTHLRTARELEPTVNLALSRARVARFFAGSPALEPSLAAIEAVWPLASNMP
ncbi:MAG: winged helix-turn-helix domain-containing protein [Novosphingobium sp.]|nr:winged helix-turn-helix domain-containing protein [Novosphingobium sp.]